jgi:hypothetical protein
MGKKSNAKDSKKKLTKKEKKQQTHLKLIQGKGGSSDKSSGNEWNQGQDDYKKSA